VTICTQHRECLFGEITDGVMQLNQAGQMSQSVWVELPQRYPGVGVDVFVVMPNHIRGIILLTNPPVGAGPCACPINQSGQPPHNQSGQPRGVAPTMMSLPDVVHRFKSFKTHQYITGVTQQGWLPFAGKLWQRNYYDRLIRNQDALTRIRRYIINNPQDWAEDAENPHYHSG